MLCSCLQELNYVFMFIGPIWICITLVFAIAISGNLFNFLVHLGRPDYKYTPEFRKGSSLLCSFLLSLIVHTSRHSICISYLLLKTFDWNMLCFAVSIAATAIFSYAWLVPLGLWGFLLWRSRKTLNLVSYSFMEILCVYGYSLSIYIPVVVSHFRLVQKLQLGHLVM